LLKGSVYREVANCKYQKHHFRLFWLKIVISLLVVIMFKSPLNVIQRSQWANLIIINIIYYYHQYFLFIYLWGFVDTRTRRAWEKGSNPLLCWPRRPFCSQFHQHFTSNIRTDILLPKKNQSQTANCSFKKLFCTKRVAIKMLTKLTPVVNFIHILCARFCTKANWAALR